MLFWSPLIYLLLYLCAFLAVGVEANYSTIRMVEHEYNTSHLNIILNNSIHSATHMLTHLIESVVLVLEAGYEARIDLQGVVVSSQLE